MPLGSQAALWAAGLVIATVLSPATQPAARLGSLEREHAQHVLETRPDMAWRYGMREAADRLTPVTQGSMDREALWLRAFRTRLFAVSRTGLAAADRARLDSLHARTEREWLQASPESPLRTDPLAYRMLTDRAVLEVGTTRRVGACERTRRATQRLRAVPEILRAAAINLRAVSVDESSLAAGVAPDYCGATSCATAAGKRPP